MELLVPFDPVEPNSRLAPVCSPAERRSFARAMAQDVVEAVSAAGHTPRLVTTAPTEFDCRETVDDRSLTRAVNARLAGHEPSPADPLGVVMADLPLVGPETVRRLTAGDEDVRIAPGLGGGTNALVVRHPAFRVDYHGASCLDHEQIAREVGATAGWIDSRRLATDIDEPQDLTEVLLHGEGAARAWLTDHGFEIDVGDGRVSVTRCE